MISCTTFSGNAMTTTLKCYTRLLTILLLTGLSSLVNAADLTKVEITFKGIQFDKPGEMEKVKQMCLDTPAEREVVGIKIPQRSPSNCVAEPNSNDHGLDQVSFDTSFGSLEKTRIQFSRGAKDTLISVSIFSSADDVMALVEPLMAKYGAPKVKPVVLEMRNGAHITREILTWTDRRGTVMTLNPAAESVSAAADLRYGRLSIESAQLRTIKAKMKDAVTSAVKSNL